MVTYGLSTEKRGLTPSVFRLPEAASGPPATGTAIPLSRRVLRNRPLSGIGRVKEPTRFIRRRVSEAAANGEENKERMPVTHSRLLRVDETGRRIRDRTIMEQDVLKIARQYDAIAREYAQAFRGEHAWKPMDREVLRRFARELGGRGPVWDLGCGPGQTAKYLHDLGVDIAGLDLSEKILEQARALHPGVPFRRGNILELDFESGSVTGVVAFYAIVHFTKERVGTAFREVSRVLRPGGTLLLAFHAGDGTIHLEEFLGRKVDIDFMFFRPDFIIRCLEDSGFAGIETIERAPYPDVEYPSRRAYVFAKKPGGG
jgi:SAM-dependent methyltransferase